MIKEIKTVIATTLPDVFDSKFTKNVLKTFSDQINIAIPRLKVIDSKSNEIGDVKFGEVSKGSLKVTMNIETDKIDKNWEYYFIPEGLTRKKEIQGKFTVIQQAILKGISMVRFPSDPNLKPVIFEDKKIEGKDYLIKKYNEVTEEMIQESITNVKPLYVYYPQSLNAELIIADAESKGLLKNGEKVFPISVCGWDGSFTQFKNIVIEQWTIANTEITGNLLKKLTGKQ